MANERERADVHQRLCATSPAAVETRPRSSTPAPAAQRVSEHRGQDKHFPAVRGARRHQSEG
eukprot:scaffold123351_cov39-Phaeocystis_antarctica.AAC.1